MGADGWLSIGWPEDYGGQGRSAVEQFIFFDEVERAGAPFPFVTLNTVGPTIMRFGTDEQKSRFLPGILAGEINFAIGYTEPEAGTDLASLRTTAARDGDEYVINGKSGRSSPPPPSTPMSGCLHRHSSARKMRGGATKVYGTECLIEVYRILLEEFGFCGEGEAKDFIKDGNIELGGRLPINTNGGQLG